jgi:hypothetical protein
MDYQPIETAPKDGTKIYVLSIPYDLQHTPDDEISKVPAQEFIAWWNSKGNSWIGNGQLALTGLWMCERGWLQPDEVSHWRQID